ncbi:MAG: hypothetical protein ACREKN_08555 [Longimicrobiaceae bacterium]
MKRLIGGILGVLLLVAAVPAQAQDDSELTELCRRPELGADEEQLCYTVAQAVASTQPRLGMLIAVGNPALGSTGASGLRLGVIPRLGATAKLNLIFVRVPDVLLEQADGGVQDLNESLGIPLPAVGGDLSVGVFSGINVAPTIGGIGAVDLLGSLTWIPFSALDVEGFDEETPDFAYGVGARIGLLGESFTAPGIAVSIMYRRLDQVGFGDICPDEQGAPQEGVGECANDNGDLGEFSFDLTDWSTRATIGKRFLGLGLLAGVGYDRYSSRIDYGFRGNRGDLGLTGAPTYRQLDVDLSSERLSAFANLSYTLLFGSIALEAGWQQGSDPIEGFQESFSDFDPGQGAWFGSLGLRLAI